MKITEMTGETCVGDWRLAPLDIGFDLKLQGIPVVVPDEFDSVGVEFGKKTYLIEGTREEMIAAVEKAGYKIVAAERAAPIRRSTRRRSVRSHP